MGESYRYDPPLTHVTAMVYFAWQRRDANKTDDENLKIICDEFGMHIGYVIAVLDAEHETRENK